MTNTDLTQLLDKIKKILMKNFFINMSISEDFKIKIFYFIEKIVNNFLKLKMAISKFINVNTTKYERYFFFIIVFLILFTLYK